MLRLFFLIGSSFPDYTDEQIQTQTHVFADVADDFLRTITDFWVYPGQPRPP